MSAIGFGAGSPWIDRVARDLANGKDPDSWSRISFMNLTGEHGKQIALPADTTGLFSRCTSVLKAALSPTTDYEIARLLRMMHAVAVQRAAVTDSGNNLKSVKHFLHGKDEWVASVARFIAEKCKPDNFMPAIMKFLGINPQKITITDAVVEGVYSAARTAPESEVTWPARLEDCKGKAVFPSEAK